MKLTKESCNQSKESCGQRRPMKMLVVLLWVSILLEVISMSFGCFDLREYYGQGRCAYIVSYTCFALMDIWLAMAITRRKNWARKSYIVMTVLLIALWTMVVCFSSEDYASGNSLVVGAIDAINNAVSLICCGLLFTKKVRVAFGQGVAFEGSKAIANVCHCLLYWFVYVMIWVGFVVQMLVHYGSEEHVSDCKKAAILGSVSARDALVETVKEKYVAEMMDEDKVREKEKEAEKFVDEFIENNKPPRKRGGLE